jgi:hypothetical protein
MSSQSQRNPRPTIVVAVVAHLVMAKLARVVVPLVGARVGKKKAGVNDAATD